MLNNTPEPSGQGFVINFNMAAYGGSGADGISFFLVDGSHSPTQVGAYGGGLGYAQSSANSTNGIDGGYLGLGFDEFGNFANDGDGHGQGCATPAPGLTPQSVTIRGASAGLNGYCYITSSGTLSQGISAGSSRSGATRSVRITISPSGQIGVKIDFHDGNGYVPVIQPTNFTGLNGQPAFPATFKFGFASSTGGSTNYHEIWNLDIAPDPSTLSVSSTHSDPFTPGSTGTYTLNVQNAATASPTRGSTVITDTIPLGLTPRSADGGTDWTCPITGQQVVCTYQGAGITSGASAHSIAVGVTIPHDVASSTLTNTVTLTSAGDTNASATASDSTHIVPSATLALSGAAPASVTAGQTLTATATLSNTGPSDAAHPVVTYAVPASLSFVSLTNPDGWSCDGAPSGGNVSCRAATIAARAATSFTLVATVKSNDASGSPITSAFTATSDASSPATTSQTTAVTTASALALSAQAPAQVTAGRSITYTATLTNTGPSDAASPVVTFTVPAYTSFTSLAGPAGWTCVGTPDNKGQVACQTGTLAATGTADFTLVTSVNSNTPSGATLRTDVSAGAGDAVTTSTSASAMTNATTSSVLSLSALAPSAVDAGQNVAYTATLTNNGPSDAASPIVTFTVPAHTTFVSLNGPAGWTCGSAPDGQGQVTCQTGTLVAGAAANFTLVANAASDAPHGGALTSNISANAADAAGVSATAAAATVTTVSALNVVVQAPATVVAGQTVTYTATLANNGPSDAASAAVAFAVPAHTTFVSLTGSAGWTCDSAPNARGQVSCHAAGLAVHGTASFALTFTVNSNVAGGSTLAASVAATSDATANAGTASFGDAVAATSSLSVAETARAATIVAGQDAVFSVSMTNNGPSDAADPTVSFTLPAGTTLASLDAALGWSCGAPTGNGLVTCAGPRGLAAGTTAAFTLRVHTNAGAPAGTLTSSVTVTSGTSSAASASARVDVRALPATAPVRVAHALLSRVQHVDATAPQTTGRARLSSLTPIEVCVQTRPRAEGFLSLTVTYPYGRNPAGTTH